MNRIARIPRRRVYRRILSTPERDELIALICS